MKKTLAFILTLVMLLSCLSVTAFAGGQEPSVVIAGTTLTADGIVSNTAITSGTVTYTAASGGNPAKLILENAVISGPCEAPIISVNDLNLVIELIGNNQVTAGSNAAVISMGTELTITGSGSLIIHGNGGEGSVAIGVKGFGGITLSEGCKMVGSTSTTETVIDTMSEVTFDADKKHIWLAKQLPRPLLSTTPMPHPENPAIPPSRRRSQRPSWNTKSLFPRLSR